MNISFKCRGCGVGIRVKDTAAGKAVQCPKCQTKLKVPAPKVEELVELEDIEEPEELPKPVRRRVPEPPPKKVVKKKKTRARSDGDGSGLWAKVGAGFFTFLFLLGFAARVACGVSIEPKT